MDDDSHSNSSSSNNNKMQLRRRQKQRRLSASNSNRWIDVNDHSQSQSRDVRITDRTVQLSASFNNGICIKDFVWWFDDVTFGWDHLTSKLLGHTLIPSTTFLLVRFFVSKYLCFDVEISSFSVDSLLVDTFPSTRQTPSVSHHVAVASNWILLVVCPALASILALRVVRKRRLVWFRHAFGSKSYYNDSDYRRESVRHADQRVQNMFSSLIARTMKVRRQRHHQQQKKQHRSIQKANRTFEHKHKNDEEQRSLRHKLSAISSSSSLSSSLSSVHSPRAHILSSETHCKKAQTIFHDHVLVPTIRTVPYVHGGYFGAAPFMLADRKWVLILRRLLPDVYIEIGERVLNCQARQLIHWAENNPVMAAYGTWYHLCMTRKNNGISRTDDDRDDGCHSTEYTVNTFPTLEWDVFIDPCLVGQIEALLQAKDLLATNDDLIGAQASGQAKSDNKVDIELERLSEEIVDRLLIAHGNLWQLILEQTGVLKQYNYDRVLQTRKTLGGGMFARHWMQVFAEAIRLGLSAFPSSRDVGQDDDKEICWDDDVDSWPCGTMILSDSIAESVRKIKSITGSASPMGLVLDIKSRHFVPKRVWAVVIDTLKTTGIRVCGIGAFHMDEIRDVTKLCINPDRSLPTTKELLFVHSAGDIQAACESGKIRPGDHVYFNCGSLLYTEKSFTFSFPFDPSRLKGSYIVDSCASTKKEEDCVSLIHYKQKYNFALGCYLQEFAVDEAALSLLVDHINNNPTLFDLGLAWGGLNGLTVHNITPGRFTDTTGYWDQRRLGRCWKKRSVGVC